MKNLMMIVFTAATANNGKEAIFGGVAALLGVLASDYLGGWDKGIQVLMTLMVADYVAGILMALKTRSVNSDVMFWGGIRKITVLFIVGLAAMLDEWVSNGTPVFRTAAIYFYGGREGLSVIENLGTLGVPIPVKIKSFLGQLNQNDVGDSK